MQKKTNVLIKLTSCSAPNLSLINKMHRFSKILSIVFKLTASSILAKAKQHSSLKPLSFVSSLALLAMLFTQCAAHKCIIVFSFVKLFFLAIVYALIN